MARYNHDLGKERISSPPVLEGQQDEADQRRDTKTSEFKSLGLLDRFLAIWIFLAMAIGIILGNFVPNTGPALQKGKFVGVSVPIGSHSLVIPFSTLLIKAPAIGLLVMMYPILCKIKYETLHNVFQSRQVWVQIVFSIVLNWIVAPFLMASLPDPGIL